MIYSKYIIEDQDLILSNCTMHNDLVTDKKNVKGGGLFKYEDNIKTFTLFGSSFEFGTASLKDVKACVEADRVYTNVSRTNSIANRFKFVYDTQTDLIFLN